LPGGATGDGGAAKRETTCRPVAKGSTNASSTRASFGISRNRPETSATGGPGFRTRGCCSSVCFGGYFTRLDQPSELAEAEFHRVGCRPRPAGESKEGRGVAVFSGRSFSRTRLRPMGRLRAKRLAGEFWHLDRAEGSDFGRFLKAGCRRDDGGFGKNEFGGGGRGGRGPRPQPAARDGAPARPPSGGTAMSFFSPKPRATRDAPIRHITPKRPTPGGAGGGAPARGSGRRFQGRRATCYSPPMARSIWATHSSRAAANAGPANATSRAAAGSSPAFPR